jgi:hypothetical protein
MIYAYGIIKASLINYEAEHSLRAHQLVSQDFTEPEGSLLPSEELSTSSYPHP